MKVINEMSRILLVEDDTMIASGITYALEMEGYKVCIAYTITEAKDYIEKNQFNLAILDMQLPDGIGFDLSGKLKSSRTSIIFLTVVDDENTIIKAFDDGAEDYILKPFRIRELLARVRRVLSINNNHVGNSNIICIGQIKINIDDAKVYIDDKMIDLTALEYRLLLIFANNQGILLSRQQILDKIWDVDGNFVEDNTLTVYVKRLREKLGKAIKIETVRGMGYRVD
ncbi:MAG: response regulator transcription factor [Lachnospiraceae bacterium]